MSMVFLPTSKVTRAALKAIEYSSSKARISQIDICNLLSRCFPGVTKTGTSNYTQYVQ